ncbi:hypothetical protein CYMTET_43298 [Cymbomonas tetramitiformis]|uniref:Uncharacterized protein n=1 Tax=Cymbomonas tetramitiformis TaxID=36881 RepID=A0AAE0C4I5_9CHLO|nr:hypothetical protein CYMTET_43298 [Cymbomonas tetramitiformis]
MVAAMGDVRVSDSSSTPSSSETNIGVIVGGVIGALIFSAVFGVIFLRSLRKARPVAGEEATTSAAAIPTIQTAWASNTLDHTAQPSNDVYAIPIDMPAAINDGQEPALNVSFNSTVNVVANKMPDAAEKRDMLVAFYQRYSPPQVVQVGAIMDAYTVEEIQKMCLNKYNADPFTNPVTRFIPTI